jgi:hypothetical protein
MDDRSAVWRNLEPETLPQPVFIPELTTSKVEGESVTFVPSISDQDFMLFTRQETYFQQIFRYCYLTSSAQKRYF